MVVEFWMARLDQPLSDAETQCLTAALPEQRRERLARLKSADWQREPLCAYWLLRHALQTCCGITELPPMEHTPSGKPYFPGRPELHFSISHTDGAVMVGLADREIGVDIERIRPVKAGMLRRFGCAAEASFFDVWVRREARAKRTGSPVELGQESVLLQSEQIVYPESFPGYAACGVWLGEETPRLHHLTMEQLLQEIE